RATPPAAAPPGAAPGRAAMRCSPASTARGGCPASAPAGTQLQPSARAPRRSTHADLDAVVGARGAVPVAGGDLAPRARVGGQHARRVADADLGIEPALRPGADVAPQ